MEKYGNAVSWRSFVPAGAFLVFRVLVAAPLVVGGCMATPLDKKLG